MGRRRHGPAAGTTTTAGEDDDVDEDGVLVRAVPIDETGGLSFDPASMQTGQYVYTYPVHASLLKLKPDGTTEPDLALGAEITDPSTIEVELRPGLVFSDGTPLDAQAVVNSIQRTKDARPPGLRTAELGLIASMTVTSPTTFTVATSTPSAGLVFGLLTDAEFAPVAPATIAAPGPHGQDVIAAGPFKIQSYEPGNRIRMVKNDRYWDAANVRLAGVDYINAASPEAIVNSLQSNTADYATVPFAGRKGLSDPVEALVLPTTGAYQINMCVRDDNPLGDVRVRQALAYATDRNAVNQLLFDGESTVAWGLAPEGDRLHNPELDELYEYDPGKAQVLLTAAGYPDGFEITAVTGPGDPLRLHEIIQQQWQDVGIKTTIVPSTNIVADWYTANGSNGLLNAVPLLRLPTEDFTRNFASTAFANVCKTPFAAIDACARDLSALNPNSAAYVSRYRECQKSVVQDDVFGVMTVFNLQVLGVNTDRIGNLTFQPRPAVGPAARRDGRLHQELTPPLVGSTGPLD